MRRSALSFCLALIAAELFVAPVAHAAIESSAFLQTPSRFQTQDLSLSSRGLGETCYARDLMPDGSVCNPAFSDSVKQGFLMARLYLGNGYGALSTANSLIFQPVTKEFLTSLFQNHNVTTLEGEAGLFFATPHFSAAFMPYRVQYFSEVHNPDFPVLTIQAAVERALEFQGGTNLEFLGEEYKDFSIGGKIRILDRSYVSSTFSLAQTLNGDPKAVLPVKQQYAAYFEPTLGWRPQIAQWRLWTSVGLTNLGGTSNSDPLYRAPVDIASGVGVEPPVKYGRLRIGMDMVNLLNNGGDLSSIFRLGGSYKLGVLEAMAGWNRNAITGGMLFGFQMIQVGLVYEFMRSELQGGFSENRISTEASLRL